MSETQNTSVEVTQEQRTPENLIAQCNKVIESQPEMKAVVLLAGGPENASAFVAGEPGRIQGLLVAMFNDNPLLINVFGQAMWAIMSGAGEGDTEDDTKDDTENLEEESEDVSVE